MQRLYKYAGENGLTDQSKKLKGKVVKVDSLGDILLAGKIHHAQPDDVCFIQFSSGSTSDPKGVVLTHRNLILNVLAKGAAGGYTSDDVSLSWMPLTHDMGLIGFHINMVVCYMHHCIMSTDLFSRRPMLWMQKVSEHKASVICSPNFGYKHYLKALADREIKDMDLSCVRVILNGAEPISTRLCDQFLERMAPYGLKHSAMLPVYGLAEATLAVSFPRWGQDYRAVHVDRHKLKVGDKVTFSDKNDANTVSFPVVGFAVPDMAIRIGDINGNVYEENTIGSIMIHGPTVTQGYYKDEQATKSVMTPDGWLDTGDLGFLVDGELVITGRSKEIIFAHGQNYYPHDLESILVHHAGFELGKVAVYGIWEEEKQRDELVVFVVFRGDLPDFLPVANRAALTVSEQTGLEVDAVVPVNSIPKTTSGKFQRRILGEAFKNGEYDQALQQLALLDKDRLIVEDNDATPLQKELIELCNSALQDRKLGLHDNFFEIGISSLMLAELHQRIDEVYPDKIDIVDLFEYQTIYELSAFLESKLDPQDSEAESLNHNQLRAE